jgi:hypothetical protein
MGTARFLAFRFLRHSQTISQQGRKAAGLQPKTRESHARAQRENAQQGHKGRQDPGQKIPLCLALPCNQPTKTNMLVEKSGTSSGEFQVLEGSKHLALESLIMKVEGMEVLWWAARLGTTDSGQHRLEDLLPQDKQCR